MQQFLHLLYLNGGFRQIESSGQFASPRPGDVIFPIKLLLQPADLLPGKGCAVPPDLISVGVVVGRSRGVHTGQ